jgi:hypothetical protein
MRSTHRTILLMLSPFSELRAAAFQSSRPRAESGAGTPLRLASSIAIPMSFTISSSLKDRQFSAEYMLLEWSG